jgi:membrane-associated protease RseP (regulator of RpoE activity)
MRAMLNMDMVGRLGDGPLIVNGVDTAEEWRPLLQRAAAAAGVSLAMSGAGDGPSDHTSFYTSGVPVLHFFTNVHADYHRSSDDWQRIDLAGLERVARIVGDVAATLGAADGAITFVPGAVAPRPANQTGGYGAYLGSIPDFTPVDRGVLLSGVSPGSPAEAAGIRGGDVIIKLGQHDVADLQGLTDALRAHRPGDTVDVLLRRDGRDVTVRVTLRSRAER